MERSRRAIARDSLANLTGFLFAVALLGSVVFMIWYCSVFDEETSLKGECYQIKNVSYSVDGSELIPLVLPSDIVTEEGNELRIVFQLPKDLANDMWISIFTGHDLAVYVDGEERYSFIEEDVQIPGGVEKSVYHFISVSEEDAGKTVEIVRSAWSDHIYAESMYLGNLTGLFMYLTSGKMVYFVAAILLFVVSFIASTFGFFYGMLKGHFANIFLASLGVLMVAFWMILDNDMFQLVFRVRYIDGVVSFIEAILIPVPFSMYLDRMQRHRYHLYHQAIQLIAVFSCIIFSALHFGFGIGFYDHLVIYTGILCGCIVAGGVTVLADIYMNRMRNYIAVLVGFIGLLIFSLLL